jgi:hypothetical protein
MHENLRVFLKMKNGGGLFTTKRQLLQDDLSPPRLAMGAYNFPETMSDYQ